MGMFAAGAGLGVFNVTIGAVTKPFEMALGAVQAQLARFGAQLDAIGFGALGGGFGEMTQNAVELETKLAILTTTTGLAGAALGVLQSQMYELARVIGGVSLSELFGIATFAGRIGLVNEKLIGFTRDVGMITTVLRDIPADEIALRMQVLLNVFGLGTEKAIGFASALNALDKMSVATGRDILDMTARLAGHAQALGISIQQTMALTAAMRDAAIEVEIGTTAVAQLLTKMSVLDKEFAAIARLADPTLTFKKFAEVLKKDALGALLLFIKGFKELDPTSQMKALDAMGLIGRTMGGTILKLETAIEGIGKYTKVANHEFREHTSIMKDFATMNETTEAKIGRMNNVIQIMSASLGMNLAPAIHSVIEAVTHMANAITDWVEAHKKAIGEWVKMFAGLIDSFSMITDEFDDVSELVKIHIEGMLNWLLILGENAFNKFWEMFINAGMTATIAVVAILDELRKTFMDLMTPGYDPSKETLTPAERMVERVTKAMEVGKKIGVDFGGIGDDLGGLPLSPEKAKRKKELEDKLRGASEARELREHPELIKDPAMKEVMGDVGAVASGTEAMFDRILGKMAPPKAMPAGAIGETSEGFVMGKGTKEFEVSHEKKGPGTYALPEYYKALRSGSMETDTKKSMELLRSMEKAMTSDGIKIAPAGGIGGRGGIPAVAAP